MFLNYRKIQKLSIQAEQVAGRENMQVTYATVDSLAARYQAILDETENHTSGDHFRNLPKKAKGLKNVGAKQSQKTDQAQNAILNEERDQRKPAVVETPNANPSTPPSISSYDRWKAVSVDKVVTALPYASLVVPAALFVPLVMSFFPGLRD